MSETPDVLKVVLPPQVETQAASVVDRMWGVCGMALIHPQTRKAMVNIIGVSIIQAFNAGVTHQRSVMTASTEPTHEPS